MALPAGISTATVTVGVPVTFSGGAVRSIVTITPSAFLVHTVTGHPLVNMIEEVSTTDGVAAQFTLPVTDQDGFQDENGNAYKNWYYTASIQYVTDKATKPAFTKVFQLVTGQSVVDLDLLPSGNPAIPYTAPIATVTSVNGQTGAVTVEGATDSAVAEQVTSGPETVAALSATIDLRAADLFMVAAPSNGTDDTTQLQAGINAAASKGIAFQLRTDETYLVSDSLTTPSNCAFVSYGASIQAKPGTNKPVLVNADPVNGNTGIYLNGLKLDGNGANQTQQFTVAVMTRVTYSKFLNLDVQGGLRNQLFPNGTYGEGFSLVYSHHNEVSGGRFHRNSYDGLKLRGSNWNRISNVLCEDNGRSGIQISFFSPTGPPYNAGEGVEVEGSNDNLFENVIVKHSTGIPHSAAPTTSGIYIHTGARNTIRGFRIEGVQQGLGFWANCQDNNFTDGLISHFYSATARAGIDLENGTEHRNTFTNVKVRGMAGTHSNSRLVRVVAGSTDNRFINCVFEQGAATGTSTVDNLGAGTQFLDCTTALTIGDGGNRSTIRKAGTRTVSRLDSFTGAAAAIPFGWAARWNQTAATWTEDAAGYLRLVKTGNGRAALANIVAGDGQDVEVLCRVRISVRTAAATPVGIVLRGSGAAGSETGYYIAFSTTEGAGELYAQKYVAGVSTAVGLGTTDASAVWAANAWYWLKVRVRPSTSTPGAVALQGKVWADAAAEPNDWQLKVIDNAADKITVPGFHGVFGFSAATSDVDSYQVSIISQG